MSNQGGNILVNLNPATGGTVNVQQGAAGAAGAAGGIVNVQQGAAGAAGAAGGAANVQQCAAGPNVNVQQGGGIVAPRRGGVVQFGTHQVPWTGGAPGTLTEPVTHSAFCSQDSLKDAMKSEETCQMALKENLRLGLPDHKNDATVTLTEWITNVALHMQNTGMDAVFFVRKNINVATYTDLLEEWNRFSNDKINQWLDDETFDKYDR